MPHRSASLKESCKKFRNVSDIEPGIGGGFVLRGDEKTLILNGGLPHVQVMEKVCEFAKKNNFKVIPPKLLVEVLSNAQHEFDLETSQAAAEAKAIAEVKAIFKNVLEKIVCIGQTRSNKVLRELMGKSAK